jgi:hypothetical protein
LAACVIVNTLKLKRNLVPNVAGLARAPQRMPLHAESAALRASCTARTGNYGRCHAPDGVRSLSRVGGVTPVLRVEDRGGRPPLISKSAVEKSGPEIRFEAAPSVPLIARDTFVAETASKVEQMQATLRLVSRDMSQLAGKVAELQQAAEQDQRWHAFQMNEKRSKATKLDELVRSFRDLKARLDRIEARSSGDFHAYNSFEAVSRKLGELEGFREEARRIERTLTIKAVMLCAAVGGAALVIVLANALAH